MIDLLGHVAYFAFSSKGILLNKSSCHIMCALILEQYLCNLSSVLMHPELLLKCKIKLSFKIIVLHIKIIIIIIEVVLSTENHTIVAHLLRFLTKRDIVMD